MPEIDDRDPRDIYYTCSGCGREAISLDKPFPALCAECRTIELLEGRTQKQALNKIVPPWTDQQVANLNAYQRSGWFHPFTCGGDRTDDKHLDGEGLLVARHDGWHCLYCDYRQMWAHSFMAIPYEQVPWQVP